MIERLSRLWTNAMAYVALLVGAGLSVAGNVADTYRTRGADKPVNHAANRPET